MARFFWRRIYSTPAFGPRWTRAFPCRASAARRKPRSSRNYRAASAPIWRNTANWRHLRNFPPIWTTQPANNAYLDDVPVAEVLDFEKELREHLSMRHAALIARIEARKELSKDDETALHAAIAEFKQLG